MAVVSSIPYRAPIRDEIVHKDSAHPGQHDALIDEALWATLQQILVGNRIQREQGSNADGPSLLAGLLFYAGGRRLTPTHTNKKGTRYRHYVSQALITPMGPRDTRKSPIEGSRQRVGQRLPAANLERLIKDRLQQFLADPAEITAKGHTLANGLGRAASDARLRLNRITDTAGLSH